MDKNKILIVGMKNGDKLKIRNDEDNGEKLFSFLQEYIKNITYLSCYTTENTRAIIKVDDISYIFEFETEE